MDYEFSSKTVVRWFLIPVGVSDRSTSGTRLNRIREESPRLRFSQCLKITGVVDKKDSKTETYILFLLLNIKDCWAFCAELHRWSGITSISKGISNDVYRCNGILWHARRYKEIQWYIYNDVIGWNKDFSLLNLMKQIGVSICVLQYKKNKSTCSFEFLCYFEDIVTVKSEEEKS